MRPKRSPMAHPKGLDVLYLWKVPRRIRQCRSGFDPECEKRGRVPLLERVVPQAVGAAVGHPLRLPLLARRAPRRRVHPAAPATHAATHAGGRAGLLARAVTRWSVMLNHTSPLNPRYCEFRPALSFALSRSYCRGLSRPAVGGSKVRVGMGAS